MTIHDFVVASNPDNKPCGEAIALQMDRRYAADIVRRLSLALMDPAMTTVHLTCYGKKTRRD
jgi:hypothetical protein